MTPSPQTPTSPLDDAASAIVLLDLDDTSGWEAAQAKFLADAENATEPVKEALQAAAEKLTDFAAQSPEQRQAISNEVTRLIQAGLEKVWEQAQANVPNEETKPIPSASTPPSVPAAPTTSAVAPAVVAQDALVDKPQMDKPDMPPLFAASPAAEPSQASLAPAPSAVASPLPETQDLKGGKFLTFFLDKEEFGFEILRVQEIISQLPITPVPRTPPHLVGVINLRGKIIPVVDLRLKLGLPPFGDPACVIIVKAHNIEVGVSVDQVSEVADIPGEQIEPPPSFGTGVTSDFLYGISKCGGRVRLLLDIDKTLSPEHLTGSSHGGATVMVGGNR